VTSVAIVPACSRRERRRFVRLPAQLYRDQPRWMPLLERDVRRAMDVRHNPFHAEAIAEHFVARDSAGHVLGRVSATIHPAFIRRHGPIAFFGHFECVDDATVAAALLARVEGWALERGFDHVAGPYSYTGTQEAGVLLSSDDAPAAGLLRPFSHAYYPALLEDAGYEVRCRAFSFTWTRDQHGDRIADLRRWADEAAAGTRLTTRGVDMRDFDREVDRLCEVYNRSFHRHPETAEISLATFRHQAHEMRQVVDPDLVRLVEDEGRLVAFALLLPDAAAAMRALDGHLNPLRLLQAQRLVRSSRDAVVVMIGVEPRSFGAGLGRVLAGEIVRCVDEGRYDTLHTTWIHERNWASRAIAERVGAAPAMTYALYEKRI